MIPVSTATLIIKGLSLVKAGIEYDTIAAEMRDMEVKGASAKQMSDKLDQMLDEALVKLKEDILKRK